VGVDACVVGVDACVMRCVSSSARVVVCVVACVVVCFVVCGKQKKSAAPYAEEAEAIIRALRREAESISRALLRRRHDCVGGCNR